MRHVGGGLDGSTGFSASITDGGSALYVLGARDLMGAPVIPPQCRVVCDAYVHVAANGSSTLGVVGTMEENPMLVSIHDGAWRVGADAGAGSVVPSEWVHVSVVASPSPDGGAATATVTLERGDVSITALIPTTRRSDGLELGATGDRSAEVHVDDVTCRVVD